MIAPADPQQIFLHQLLPLASSVAVAARQRDLVISLVTVSTHATIRAPQPPALGYHVRRSLVRMVTVEEQIFRAA
jgi:hypothetical protein